MFIVYLPLFTKLYLTPMLQKLSNNLVLIVNNLKK